MKAGYIRYPPVEGARRSPPATNEWSAIVADHDLDLLVVCKNGPEVPGQQMGEHGLTVLQARTGHPVQAAAIDFDLANFPTAVRKAATGGAEVIAVHAGAESDRDAEFLVWECRVAAMHNHVFILACLHRNPEGQSAFQAVDPFGELLPCGENCESVITVYLDLAARARSQFRWPFLKLLAQETGREGGADPTGGESGAGTG